VSRDHIRRASSGRRCGREQDGGRPYTRTGEGRGADPWRGGEGELLHARDDASFPPRSSFPSFRAQDDATACAIQAVVAMWSSLSRRQWRGGLARRGGAPLARWSGEARRDGGAPFATATGARARGRRGGCIGTRGGPSRSVLCWGIRNQAFRILKIKE
jgi:hypothetical protein